MSTPRPYGYHNPWYRIPAFLLVSLLLGVVLLGLGTWDFVRWLFSAFWSVEKKPSERPGDYWR